MRLDRRTDWGRGDVAVAVIVVVVVEVLLGVCEG